MKLLTSQKNTLYQIINYSDVLSPNQFEIIESKENDEYNTKITYKNSDFKFIFQEDKGYYSTFYVNYSPGVDKYFENTSHINWNQAVMHFSSWIESIENEVTSPDLWSQFQTSISNIDISSNFDNARFSAKEYIDLELKIKSLINRLPETNISINDQQVIIEKLDHLIILSQELGKYDWKNLFIGTILSILIQLNVTTENANILWSIIKEVFSNYFLK